MSCDSGRPHCNQPHDAALPPRFVPEPCSLYHTGLFRRGPVLIRDSMKFRHVISFGLVLAALTLAGCEDGRRRAPQTNALVVNVAPGFAELQFRRERVNPQQLTFKTVQEFTWDVDTYDFFVLERAIGANTTNREWTFSRQLSADVGSYTFVLVDNFGEVSTLILENPEESSTQTQLAVVHAGVSLPPMDIYVVEPGVGIAGATPRGTLSPLGQLPPQNCHPATTRSGSRPPVIPRTVLFASPTTTISAGIATLIVDTGGRQHHGQLQRRAAECVYHRAIRPQRDGGGARREWRDGHRASRFRNQSSVLAAVAAECRLRGTDRLHYDTDCQPSNRST